MKLKEFIQQQIEAMQTANIKSADFRVYLNSEGGVIPDGSTSVCFTIELRSDRGDLINLTN